MRALDAPRSTRRRRRPRAAKHVAPPQLPLTRVTAVRASPFAADAEAAAWLQELGRDLGALEDFAELAVRMLNRALGAQRAAAGEPYIHERSLGAAIAARVGYGSGEQVAEGEWSKAREIEPDSGPRGRRARRDADLAPQERVAAVLGGREKLDACEALLARARVDVDAGREREAALQLRVGVEALLVELRGALQDPGHSEDMELLTERRGEVGKAANAALGGDLDGPTAAGVHELLGVAERVLRRRRVLRG